ncbi:MAG: hypothetical protein ACLPIC_00030 [Rhodoblastus sp.]|uniref:hypothetical protein n=1 Tax=Rhodoblastus sp. TaxID=1962975 RepID=UPI003F97B5F8
MTSSVTNETYALQPALKAIRPFLANGVAQACIFGIPFVQALKANPVSQEGSLYIITASCFLFAAFMSSLSITRALSAAANDYDDDRSVRISSAMLREQIKIFSNVAILFALLLSLASSLIIVFHMQIAAYGAIELLSAALSGLVVFSAAYFAIGRTARGFMVVRRKASPVIAAMMTGPARQCLPAAAEGFAQGE